MNSTKEIKYFRVAENVLKILSTHGESGLQIARISRATKISRPWIYKYIGKNQQDLVAHAVERFSNILGTLDKVPHTRGKKEWSQSRLKNTRHFLIMTRNYPYIVPLYYKYRGSPTFYGELISVYEKKYFAKFCEETQRALGVSQRQALFFAQTFSAIRFGLAHQFQTSTNPTEEQMQRLLKLIEAILERMIADKP